MICISKLSTLKSKAVEGHGNWQLILWRQYKSWPNYLLISLSYNYNISRVMKYCLYYLFAVMKYCRLSSQGRVTWTCQ